jgi:hypothetical protein
MLGAGSTTAAGEGSTDAAGAGAETSAAGVMSAAGAGSAGTEELTTEAASRPVRAVATAAAGSGLLFSTTGVGSGVETGSVTVGLESGVTTTAELRPRCADAEENSGGSPADA